MNFKEFFENTEFKPLTEICLRILNYYNLAQNGVVCYRNGVVNFAEKAYICVFKN